MKSVQADRYLSNLGHPFITTAKINGTWRLVGEIDAEGKRQSVHHDLGVKSLAAVTKQVLNGAASTIQVNATAKYRVFDDPDATMIMGGVKLKRIVAVKNFGDVKVGDKGGFVESEANLAQSGLCWIRDKACAYGNARVSGAAQLRDHASVSGNAQVYEQARVQGHARVNDNAHVMGTAFVTSSSKVEGSACVGGKSQIRDDACVRATARVVDSKVCDNAVVQGTARVSKSRVYDSALIEGNAEVCESYVEDEAKVGGLAKLSDSSLVDGTSSVYGSTHLIGSTVSGDSTVEGGYFENTHVVDGKISSTHDVLTISPVGSQDGVLTIYIGKDNVLMASRGCFHGTIKEFRDAVEQVHGSSECGQQYRAIIEMAKSLPQFKVTK